MKKVLLTLIGACAIATTSSLARSQGIVGTVANASGQAVEGAKVSVQAQGSNITQSAITNAQGQYELGALTPGLYSITLNPASTNLKGQSVQTYLDGRGLTVNWKTSPNRDPIAVAQLGTNTTSTSSVDPLLGTTTGSTVTTTDDKEPKKPKKSKKD